MQDRFKFRAWRKDKKEMSSEFTFMNSISISNMCFDTDGLPDDRYSILMQCTGLKDKNGKLIYEGDVLEYIDECRKKKHDDEKEYISHYCVGYSDELSSCGCCFPEFMGAGFSAENLSRSWGCLTEVWDACEIIGNKFENPELLKEEIK